MIPLKKMKFTKPFLLLIAMSLFTAFFSISCKVSFSQIKSGITESGELFDAMPESIWTDQITKITWINPEAGLLSYKAEVDVFTMNNRRDTNAVQTDTYTISIKEINGNIYTRLDFIQDGNEGTMRSIIANGTEMLMLDTETNAVHFRIRTGSPIPQELDFFRNEAMLTKIDLSFIIREAQRLAYTIREDRESGGLILELPSHLFAAEADENRISTRVVFDLNKELLNHTEVISILSNGIHRTSTAYPLYQEYNGTYIKTGMVHIIENINPKRISSGTDTRIYNSPDDYPIISRAEYERLAQSGLAHPAGEMFFGDPFDLSYTETIINVYRNIEINTVQDSLFRVFLVTAELELFGDN